MDLSLYYNLNDLILNIPESDVCPWVSDQRKNYEQINIQTVPGDLCKGRGSTANENDDDDEIERFTLSLTFGELLGIGSIGIVICILGFIGKISL